MLKSDGCRISLKESPPPLLVLLFFLHLLTIRPWFIYNVG